MPGSNFSRVKSFYRLTSTSVAGPACCTFRLETSKNIGKKKKNNKIKFCKFFKHWFASASPSCTATPFAVGCWRCTTFGGCTMSSIGAGTECQQAVIANCWVSEKKNFGFPNFFRFLHLCETAPLFGCCFFTVRDKSGTEWCLALNSRQMAQLDPRDPYRPKRVCYTLYNCLINFSKEWKFL